MDGWRKAREKMVEEESIGRSEEKTLDFVGWNEGWRARKGDYPEDRRCFWQKGSYLSKNGARGVFWCVRRAGVLMRGLGHGRMGVRGCWVGLIGAHVQTRMGFLRGGCGWVAIHGR